jgi:hypothetical protein
LWFQQTYSRILPRLPSYVKLHQPQAWLQLPVLPEQQPLVLGPTSSDRQHARAEKP